MEVTNFNENWNKKLHCDCFTTIRLRNDYKYHAGAVHELTLKRQKMHPAKIVEVKYFLLHQLTEGMCYLDTGYSKHETQKLIRNMYPKCNFEHQQLVWVLYKRLTQLDITQQKQLF